MLPPTPQTDMMTNATITQLGSTSQPMGCTPKTARIAFRMPHCL